MNDKDEKSSSVVSSPKQRIISFLKNKETIGFFVSMAIMALIALAFFSPDAMQGHVLQQHDTQQKKARSEQVHDHVPDTGQDDPAGLGRDHQAAAG